MAAKVARESKLVVLIASDVYDPTAVVLKPGRKTFWRRVKYWKSQNVRKRRLCAVT
jgi:hypothetical protein